MKTLSAAIKARTYTIITSEPGYSGSEQTAGTGLTLNKAISMIYNLKRVYRANRDSNPSYVEIRADGTDEFIYNRHLDTDDDWDLMAVRRQIYDNIRAMQN